MTYEQARLNVRAIGLGSREKFLKWHHKERPMWIPRYPERVYGDDWLGWNDFLGNNNVFAPNNFNVRDGSKFLPYWEAVRVVQKLAAEYELTSQLKYLRWHREKDGELDIIDRLPRTPQHFYQDDWQGWPVWLGKTIEGKLIAAKDAVEAIGLLCLVRDPSLPQNVATVVKCKDGKSELIDMLKANRWQYVRVYKYSEEDEELFWQIINQFSRPFQGVDNERLCGMGAAQMVSELDMQMLRVNFP